MPGSWPLVEQPGHHRGVEGHQPAHLAQPGQQQHQGHGQPQPERPPGAPGPVTERDHRNSGSLRAEKPEHSDVALQQDRFTQVGLKSGNPVWGHDMVTDVDKRLKKGRHFIWTFKDYYLPTISICDLFQSYK